MAFVYTESFPTKTVNAFIRFYCNQYCEKPIVFRNHCFVEQKNPDTVIVHGDEFIINMLKFFGEIHQSRIAQILDMTERDLQQICCN